MTNCMVRGCTNTADRIFNLNEDPLMQGVVCEQHELELKISPWSLNHETQEIVIGEEGPVSLINYIITNTLGTSTVEFVFGRDGQETQRITAYVTAEDARTLCEWVNNAEHPEE